MYCSLSFISSRCVLFCFSAGLLLNVAIGSEATFEAIYAGSMSERNINASRSAGNGEALQAESSQAIFEEDLVAHSGVFGIRLGVGQSEIHYESGKNLPAEEGKITFQFASSQWLKNAADAWTIWQVGSAAAPQLQIKRAKAGGLEINGVDAKDISFSIKTENISPFVEEGKDDKEEKLRFEVRYSRPHIQLFVNDKLAGEAAWNGAPEWSGNIRVGTSSGEANGIAVLEVLRIFSNPAEPVAAVAAAEEKKPAGAPTDWWDKGMPQLGLEALEPDYVPSPWSPVVWQDQQLQVWNRSYDLTGDALVSQIIAAEKPLLRSPVRLNIGKQEITFAPAEIVEQHKGKIVLQKISQNDTFKITAHIHIEYDGMMWIELDFEPAGENPAISFNDLSLEIPFHADASEFIHYIGAPHKYESQNLAWNSSAGPLPEPGASLDLGFKTYLWIGNTERGLQWFAESDENWWPLDRINCLQVLRDNDKSATLRLEILTQPLPLQEEKNFSLKFGLMATPVKPMPKGWRGWTITPQYGSTESETRGSHLIYWPDEWRSMYLDPEPHRATEKGTELTREKVKKDHAAGRLILPYWTRIHIPIADPNSTNPDGMKMAKLWGTEPDHVRGGKLDLRRATMDSAWTDYLVWCFNEWGEKFGHIDGLYLDETQPIPNRRAESNGGYITPMGERRATFEFRGSRNYIKRINYIAEKRLGHPGTTVIHNSSTYAMPYMSAYTVFLPGEHLNSGYFKLSNPDILPPEEERAQGYYYCHVLPMERLMAEGYWQQWGVPIAWLPQLKNHKDIMDSPVAARDLLSRLQQVDTLLWPLFMNREEANKMIRFRKEFGIERDDVQFIPFWRNDTITSADDKTLVGYYERPGARLVIISNLNHTPVTTSLSFKGITPELVRDAETKKLVPLADEKQSVEITIPRNDYRALLIQENSQTTP